VFSYGQSLLALRKAHPALRTGKQWHIGWDESYYAFLRELPEEKLFVVYNNSSSSRELKIPLEDTPLAGAQQLKSVFGGTTAEITAGELRITMPSRTLAVFNVR
jgi:glycosidase